MMFRVKQVSKQYFEETHFPEWTSKLRCNVGVFSVDFVRTKYDDYEQRLSILITSSAYDDFFQEHYDLFMQLSRKGTAVSPRPQKGVAINPPIKKRRKLCMAQAVFFVFGKRELEQNQPFLAEEGLKVEVSDFDNSGLLRSMHADFVGSTRMQSFVKLLLEDLSGPAGSFRAFSPQGMVEENLAVSDSVSSLAFLGVLAGKNKDEVLTTLKRVERIVSSDDLEGVLSEIL